MQEIFFGVDDPRFVVVLKTVLFDARLQTKKSLYSKDLQIKMPNSKNWPVGCTEDLAIASSEFVIDSLSS
jgi:hypothetical protein